MINKMYQVTLYNEENRYKPISTIITMRQQEDITLANAQYKREVIIEGIKKICNKRYWTDREIRYYNYNKVKVREYNKIDR